MTFSAYYIGFHLVALVAAILFDVLRTRWMWIPYGLFILLEVPIMWRVLDGQQYPVFMKDPISLGLAALIFGALPVRWLRFRLQGSFERVGSLIVLFIHGVGLGWR